MRQARMLSIPASTDLLPAPSLIAAAYSPCRPRPLDQSARLDGSGLHAWCPCGNLYEHDERTPEPVGFERRPVVATFVHSATVLVRDQDAAIDFYINRLGFEKREDAPFGERSRWVVVAPPGSQAGLALLRPEDMGVPAEAVGVPTGISFVSDDIQGFYDQLVASGVEFTGGLEQMPWGARATWFKDQDGNQYFLTENPQE
jgi:uncharacterized glyoxalase superfamily protein PhnB